MRCKKSFGEFLTSELGDNSCLACAPHSFSLGENENGSNPNPFQSKRERPNPMVRIRSFLAGMDGFEPSKCQSQSLVPYRLATSQYCLDIVAYFTVLVKQFIEKSAINSKMVKSLFFNCSRLNEKAPSESKISTVLSLICEL